MVYISRSVPACCLKLASKPHSQKVKIISTFINFIPISFFRTPYSHFLTRYASGYQPHHKHTYMLTYDRDPVESRLPQMDRTDSTNPWHTDLSNSTSHSSQFSNVPPRSVEVFRQFRKFHRRNITFTHEY